MEYMDVKALSEVVEGYETLFSVIRQVRSDMQATGVDTAALGALAAPTMRELCRGRRQAQKRFDAAYRLYLEGLPQHKTGRAA